VSGVRSYSAIGEAAEQRNDGGGGGGGVAGVPPTFDNRGSENPMDWGFAVLGGRGLPQPLFRPHRRGPLHQNHPQQDDGATRGLRFRRVCFPRGS